MPSLAPRRNAGQQLITPHICVLPSINCTCTYMHIRHTHTENDRTGSKATWGSLYIFPLPSIFCSVCADYISSSQPNETMLKRTGHPQQGHAVTAPWTPVQVNTVSSHLCPVHRPLWTRSTVHSDRGLCTQFKSASSLHLAITELGLNPFVLVYEIVCTKKPPSCNTAPTSKNVPNLHVTGSTLRCLLLKSCQTCTSPVLHCGASKIVPNLHVTGSTLRCL